MSRDLPFETCEVENDGETCGNMKPCHLHDPINHPAHYKAPRPGLEPIEIIEAYGLNFARGSAIKYLLRAGKKASASEVEDLEKAAWFCRREAERIKNG